MAKNIADWCLTCPCHKHRGSTIRPPHGTLFGDDKYSLTLPFVDVQIDVQGPYTRSEGGGYQYVLSYMCTRLKVPIMAPIKSLQSGYFSRALVSCIMRARRIPSIIRSDRGPEMTNRIIEEFKAICGTFSHKGAPLTPRHQSLLEKYHHLSATHHTI